MRITRTSLATGKEHTLDIPVSQEQMDSYEMGESVQDAFPNLPPELREFIKTGITPDEWKTVVTGEDGQSKYQPGLKSSIQRVLHNPASDKPAVIRVSLSRSTTDILSVLRLEMKDALIWLKAQLHEATVSWVMAHPMKLEYQNGETPYMWGETTDGRLAHITFVDVAPTAAL